MEEQKTDSALTFQRFSRANRERCEADDGFGHLVSDWTPAEWLAACVGELGEAAHVIKRISRQRDSLVESRFSDDQIKKMLAEEIADTVIYLDMLAHSQNIDLGAAIVDKFNRKSEEIGSSIVL
ncbi:MazG nucleotide pyrophosphohydrolase domain-containing protein [Roseovarius nitratireducens]|uniref:MazG nucleotide pyrophosphohydrolase domain-containing protein n=1 Tax=Roseovarius nitratireducens TaxID=2044597 RepID=UPI000CE2290A|nr:MazG nucleotide pyrophosphohydrolase domain-containing protein [Roseovarius nitratireducens]